MQLSCSFPHSRSKLVWRESHQNTVYHKKRQDNRCGLWLASCLHCFPKQWWEHAGCRGNGSVRKQFTHTLSAQNDHNPDSGPLQMLLNGNKTTGVKCNHAFNIMCGLALRHTFYFLFSFLFSGFAAYSLE